MSRTLILASSSPYRRELLARLGLPFSWHSPDVDESSLVDDPVIDTVQRLAQAKARALALSFPDALIIGSDQLAVCEERIIGKPGGHDQALEQLLFLTGKTVTFHTGLVLLDSATGAIQKTVVDTQVRFRQLPRAELDAYLRIEQPYQCAGSAKNEALGIALMDRIDTCDPTALTGLPLIALCGFLREAGVRFFE